MGDYLEIGYFEQEMPPDINTTCLEEIWQEFPGFTQYEVRSALAKCGLTTKHIESKVRVLSGGEQAKVRLCKLVNRESNILVLDEPTNHLDVDAKEELKRALIEYKGSILNGMTTSQSSMTDLQQTCGIAVSGQQDFKYKEMRCGP